MRRLRPLDRLIDGPPDAPGGRVLRRTRILMTVSITSANLVAATIGFAFAAFVVPVPSPDDPELALLVNGVAGAIYTALAGVVGTIWGIRSFRRGGSWLSEERAPTSGEQRLALQVPLRIAAINATLWMVAVLLFGVANSIAISPALGITVGITVALAGLTTSSVIYLLAERMNRRVFERALATGLPERSSTPGVTTRAMLAWAFGSGVAMLEVATVGLVGLTSDRVSDQAVAINSLVFGGAAIFVGLGVTWFAARATAAPVNSVRLGLGEVKAGNLDAHVPVYDASELGRLQAGFNDMATGIREREQLRDLFGRHVGEDVAHAALDRGIELGGEEREVAVLFTDITGSTQLAAERPAGEVVTLLNRFFGVVVEVVADHGGWVNKFEGDAALAVFGAPMEHDDYAGAALGAVRELAERLRNEIPELEAGIGVSAGTVVAGNIGDESRFEYTVIGDPVNEAARLTELAKEVEGRVLASAAIVERAGDEEAARWELGDTAELRGRQEATRLATPAV